MSTEPTPISSELNRYIQDHTGGRDEVLRRVERETAELGDRILEDDRVDSVMLGMAVGLTLVRRRPS